MADVVVVGSGPNGLAAAVIMARAGLRVEVVEAQDTLGGGARTVDLGLATGVRHDLCSAVHPMAAASPFFRDFDLSARGVRLRYSDVSYAQPLDGGRAGIAFRDIDATADALGPDGSRWRRLFGRLASRPGSVVDIGLSDHRGLPRDLLSAVRLGTATLEQGTALWNLRWRTEVAPALLTGVAAHSITDMPNLPAGGLAMVLGALGHQPGWPVPEGGSQVLADAMLADLTAHGGSVATGVDVADLRDLPEAQAYLLDVAPAGLLRMAGDRLPSRYARALARFKHGAGVAKVDFVISGPVPWTHPDVGRASTVHVGGTRREMVEAEAAIVSGRHADRPVMLVSDPAALDPSREVAGLRPLWTYAHVPVGSTADVGDVVQAQIERFAPGFGDMVVARRTIPAAHMVEHNQNYVGGDISAGAIRLARLFGGPVPRWDAYRTPLPGVYLCSASTPPGPGVHGLCGMYAAARALRDRFGIRRLPSLAPT